MLRKIWLKIKYSFWLEPAIIMFASFLLAVITGIFDSGRWIEANELLPSFMLTGLDLAHTILGITSAAMLTMTIFTFSTTMVVLTTYSSQYSPRVVRNFLTDDETVRTLGIFLGGFIYSIMALSFMKISLINRQVISANISIIYIIGCLIQFLLYVNHVGSFIQVKNLIQRLYDHADICIQDYRKLLAKGEISELEEPPAKSKEHRLFFEEYGYIRLIDYDSLIRLSTEFELYLRLPKITGIFVTAGSYAMSVYYAGDDIERIADRLLGCITIGNEPLEDQDFLFSLQKINEITLRSISPGINDPNTAIHCLKITGVLLSELADIENGWLLIRDDQGGKDKTAPIRCAFKMIDFEKTVFNIFYQVVHYGRQDISVVLAMLKALGFVMTRATHENRQHIMLFVDYIWQKLPDELLVGHDLKLLEKEKSECLEEL